MKNTIENKFMKKSEELSRRELFDFFGKATGAAVLLSAGKAGDLISNARAAGAPGEVNLPKAFVYTELQIDMSFKKVPWRDLNSSISSQAGLLNKTWFAGVGNNSVGGIYSFKSIEDAQRYCTVFFPDLAKKLGVAQTTRIFDGSVVKDASFGMNSPHFGVKPEQRPGAFVYTEVQVNVPFDRAPWKSRNPVLQQQKGLISKLWLSGLNTHTLGGIDAFDTIENAKEFAIHVFPKTAKKLNAAFYTRIFDAQATELASREMKSPYYI
jgi:hypothetical protein